jgi:hypothetical protein
MPNRIEAGIELGSLERKRKKSVKSWHFGKDIYQANFGGY